MWEGSIEGQHGKTQDRALRFAFFLFILSEIMFFVAFSRAFLHPALIPNIGILNLWPPAGIEVISFLGIPLLNTIILVSSGFLVTSSHYSLMLRNYNKCYFFLRWAIVYALCFIALQLFEYLTCSYSINDSVYGSAFFMATGSHGIHVMIGTTLLIICKSRLRAHVK